MAMPTVVGVGAVTSGAAGITPAYPGGYTAILNDVAFTFIESATGDTVTPPTNWAQATQSNVSTGTAPTKLTVLWRRLTASEAAPSIADAGDHMVGRMIILRGCVTTGTPFDFATPTTELVADTSVSIAAGTTAGANRLVMAAFATGQDVSSTAGTSTWANATLASVTERMDGWATAGGGGGFTMMTGEKAVAGSTGTCTATLLLTANFKAQVLIAVIGAAAAPINVTVNQVTNTNTAQAITKRKTKVVGQIAATDTAQAITKRKLKAFTQIVETNTAQAVTRRKTRTIGQVSEISASNAVTELTGQTIVVGQVVQTNTAQNVAVRKTRTIGQVVNSNTTQTINELKTKTVTQVAAADTAQAFTRRKTRAVGQITNVNTAQAFTKLKVKAIGQVTETETAQVVTRRKTVTIGQVVNTNTANTVSKSKVKLVGQVQQTNTAQSVISPGAPSTVGQVVETDTAQAISSKKIKAVGQIVETNTSRPLSKVKAKVIGQATSSDAARLIVGVTVPTVNRVNETDLARQISGGVAGTDIHGWMPLVGKHCIYLKPKTVAGNTTYVKRISVQIMAFASDGYPILKSKQSGVTYGTGSIGIRPRSHPDANEVDVYVSF